MRQRSPLTACLILLSVEVCQEEYAYRNLRLLLGEVLRKNERAESGPAPSFDQEFPYYCGGPTNNFDYHQFSITSTQHLPNG